MSSNVAIRFVGVLPSEDAEVLARRCIAGLQSVYGEVERWDLCVRPPLAQWDGGGYAVRVQARSQGAVLTTWAQAADLRDAVRDALEGVEELLVQDAGATEGSAAWLPTMARTSSMPA